MATVNFSVPNEVKQAFNAAFAGRNKSAVIAELMMQAVQEEEKHKRRAEAIERVLTRRNTKQTLTRQHVQAVREELRS